jgi:hypothetical protein
LIAIYPGDIIPDSRATSPGISNLGGRWRSYPPLCVPRNGMKTDLQHKKGMDEPKNHSEHHLAAKKT